MVRVVVCEHECVESAYTFTRERRAQRGRVGARVDQHRVPSISYEDRITLADVEHDQVRPGTHRHPDRRHDHDRQQAAQDDARGTSRAGQRPPDPDASGAGEGSGTEPNRLCLHAKGRTRKPRQQPGDPGQHAQGERGQRRDQCAGTRGDSAHDSSQQSKSQCDRDQRNRHNVRHGRDHRHHAEQRNRDGERGGLRDERKRDGRRDATRACTEPLLGPRGRKSREQQ